MAAGVPPDALGRRVSCGTDYGTVRYVGSVAQTAGKQEFPCRPMETGCFLAPMRVSRDSEIHLLPMHKTQTGVCVTLGQARTRAGSW
uniref:Uncharacterized protein n=1 Tax=Catharus ustulatus TaxID=91951 RepID=A0A8C3XYU0_CATUS